MMRTPPLSVDPYWFKIQTKKWIRRKKHWKVTAFRKKPETFRKSWCAA